MEGETETEWYESERAVKIHGEVRISTIEEKEGLQTSLEKSGGKRPCASLQMFCDLCSIDCIEKSRHLQERLIELKTEMEDMRADTRISELDRLHEENMQSGDNKYSTLQKVCGYGQKLNSSASFLLPLCFWLFILCNT